MTSSEPEESPTAAGDRPAGLRVGDVVVGAGTLLFLVGMALPWFSIDGFDLGSGYRVPAVSVNGFDSAALTVAAVLLLLAAAWTLLPAVAEVSVPFPRAAPTAGLAALAFPPTLVGWLATVDTGFTAAGLLTFLCSLVVLAAAVLRLLPDVVGTGPLPRRPAAAVRWADRPLRRGQTPTDPPTAPAHGQQPAPPGGTPPG